MPRFNLMCHGMMLFVERENTIQIAIPEIAGHEYRFGSPFSKAGQCQARLDPLPVGAWNMTAPPIEGKRIMNMISAKNHLILDPDQVAVTNLDTARTLIEVPLPNLIRMYRPLELAGRDIFTGTPVSTAVDEPLLLHDVVCLSYVGLPNGAQVTIGDWFATQLQPGAVTNTLCIYAQTEDQTHEDQAHETGINDFLVLRNGGAQATLSLSRVGTADGAQVPSPDTEMDRCQMQTLMELAAPPLFSNRTGCTGALIKGH